MASGVAGIFPCDEQGNRLSSFWKTGSCDTENEIKEQQDLAVIRQKQIGIQSFIICSTLEKPPKESRVGLAEWDLPASISCLGIILKCFNISFTNPVPG